MMTDVYCISRVNSLVLYAVSCI